MAKGIYTPDEVVTQYRQARDKQNQIAVLAQLQDCSTMEIVQLLREHGEVVDKPVARSDGRRIWTAADDALLIKLHASGLSGIAVADQMGWDVSPVYHHAKLLGLSFEQSKGSGRKLSDDDLDKIRRMASEGHSAREIADEIGRNVETVRQRGRKEGIKFAPVKIGGRNAGIPLARLAGIESVEHEANAVDEKPEIEAPETEAETPELETEAPEPDEKKAPEKPVDIEKPRIVLSPTKPLSFDDRIEAVRFLSALFGATPLDCRIEGELITLKFPCGMCQLHACMWEVAE